ncbi:MAG: exopolyphosphatase [Thioalkalivibrionaceae bacterium]
MIVVRESNGELHKIDRLKETVRLAGGLDSEGFLSDEAYGRALECLRRFGQRVRHLPRGAVRAVGTNTLRRAQNSRDLLEAFERALGHPVEIISGREEARLIYLGVSHDLAESGERRLVIDIGGGSTEFIIGEAGDAVEAESLEMGCVTYSQRFFPDGRWSASRFRDAVRHAALELQPIAESYRARGWDRVLGSSGTLLALDRAVHSMGLENAPGTSAAALTTLRTRMIEAGGADGCELSGIGEDRRPVIAGGLSIILAAFEVLGIERYFPAETALREGVVVDLLGRDTAADTRPATIAQLQHRFAVATAHAERVAEAADRLFPAVAVGHGLRFADRQRLLWAAAVHEIGLVLSHDRYHKHGEYLLANADLPGFSQTEQQEIALLVRLHRRRVTPKLFDVWAEARRPGLIALTVALRLAVLLQRSRSRQSTPFAARSDEPRQLHLDFPRGWLDQHPLTAAELDEEAVELQRLGWTLTYGSESSA